MIDIRKSTAAVSLPYIHDKNIKSTTQSDIDKPYKCLSR